MAVLRVVGAELALGQDDEAAVVGAVCIERVYGKRDAAGARRRRGIGRRELVPHTGFEPVISALRGRCPGPLDECGPVGAGGVAGPVGMIPASRGPHQTDAGGPARRPALQAVRLEEAADRIGDLLEAALADDQAVMRVRRERLVAGVEPLGEPLRVGQA